MLSFSCIVPDPIYGHLKVSAETSFISLYVLSPSPLSLAACWHVLSSRLARPLKLNGELACQLISELFPAPRSEKVKHN